MPSSIYKTVFLLNLQFKTLILYSRIYEILPHRIQQWQSTPCYADENNRASVEMIRQQQLQAKQMLIDLEKRQQELEALIRRAKKTPLVDSDQEVKLYNIKSK